MSDVTTIGTLPEDKIISTSVSCNVNTISCTDQYIRPEGEGVDWAKEFIGKKHSNFPNCIFVNASVTMQDGGWETVSVKYEGFKREKHVTFDAQSSSGSDPIDTHVDFCTFAGSKNNPNTANSNPKFNDDGTFDKFYTYMQDKTTLNDFAGVKSYLAPSLIWTEKIEYNKVTFEDLELIGTMSDPTHDSAPTPSGDRDWLVVDVSWAPKGIGCVATIKYRMSGRNGWDTDIYSKDTSGTQAGGAQIVV